MRTLHASYFVIGIATISILFVVGCASVPKEVVQLSYTLGNDISAVHISYRELIHTHFEGLRTQTLDFLNNKWAPAYLKDFIQSGDLVKMASGTDPNAVLEDVQLWVEVAMEHIDAKKKELIDPINKDEQELLVSVDEAFSRIIQANATITAHLNSLREVQEVQDQALKALNVKDLRDKVNQGLIDASEKSQTTIKKMEETDKVLQDVSKKKNDILNSVKGKDK